MSDFSTSLKEIFNERISSPFYGSLIVSWLLWNWKIPYVTFFVDQSRLGDCTNRIDYIFKHCDSIWLLVVGPLASTVAIIFLLPYVTNYAFKITAQFDRWRKDKQIEIDRTQVLTIEQSLKIFSDMEELKESFKVLMSSRDEEIVSLRKQLDLALKKSQVKPENKSKQKTNEELYKEDLSLFLTNEKILQNIDNVSNRIQRGYDMESVPVDIINYFVSNGLMISVGRGLFTFTDKGLYMLKEYTNRKLSKSSNNP